LCLTDRPENRLPFPEPDGYDPAELALLDRYLELVPDAPLASLVPDLLPHGKCDVNSIGPFSLNVLDGSNRDWLEGDRAAVRAHHLAYTQRFCFHLAQTRPEAARWGLCADEFESTGGWPHQLYVRDARRLVGEHVLTEHDLLHARPQADVVALGSYNIDIREIERTWRYLPEYHRTPAVWNEGYLSVAVPPYPIPYGSLTPPREDAENLLVPLCLSASHVAFGSVRMEPTLMLLGYAAGCAAAQAAKRGVAVQDVDVAALQDDLRDAGQVLAV
ncbi:MAG TPA: FAD-dependent oxidoreductase, partial [Gaiellaceae bacterium]|nr:FAD-dependent oxidoreductase [Gaiellaceae bacterium]